MKDEELKDFQLGGGTALSLLIGHRKSIDIDLFNRWSFDPGMLAAHLSKTYNLEDTKVLKNGIFCTIEGWPKDLTKPSWTRIKSSSAPEQKQLKDQSRQKGYGYDALK
jgi:hypothetical protein